MQTEPNKASENSFSQGTTVSKTRKLIKSLIARSHRRKFFIQFTFMTVMGWIAGGIASIAVEKTLVQAIPVAFLQSQPLWYWLVKFLALTVFAVIFAANQAIILRQYLPAWLWVLATSAGWLIANQISAAWIQYISSIAVSASLNKSLSAEEIVFFGILSTVSYILSGIWLGFLQWLVLRRDTIGAWWWNFLPSVSYFSISILVWLLSLLQNLIPESARAASLYLSGQGLTAIILGVIPAIGFCQLKVNVRRVPEKI